MRALRRIASRAKPSRARIKPLVIPEPPTYEAETEALLARFTTPADDTRAGLINDLIVALKTAGIWAKLDCLYLTAAHDAQAARQNWIQNAYNLAAVASPTFTTDRGYTTNGSSSYLDTNTSMSSLTHFQQNSAHLGVVSRTGSQASGIDIGGRVTSAANQSLMLIRGSLNNLNVRVNSNGFPTDISTSVTDGTGHFIGVRPDASNVHGYRNGSSLGSVAHASGARGALSIFIGALNANGAAANFNARQYSAAHVGGSLSAGEVSTFYSALNTYLAAVGAA